MSLAQLKGHPSEYYSQSRPEMQSFIPPSVRRLLDVGCGEGAFGEAIKKRGSEVWGVEQSSSAAQIAKQKLNGVWNVDAAQVWEKLGSEKFDCIVFNDVLEHLVDPSFVLKKAKQALSDEGVVVCSIPNVRYFFNLYALVMKKDWRYEDAGILDKTHLRFFTKKSIERLFQEVGLEIVSIKGVNGIQSWKFSLFNFCTLGFFSDTCFTQFAVVARSAQT